MSHVCRQRCSHHGRRRAFTLIELIVAVGILVVLLTIIGGVFSLAGRATTQATAVMSVHRQLRMLRETLRQDLSGVDPQRSCLAIAAVLQQTYETPTDRANGVLSDHRCDMLMFFTDTPQRPFVNPGAGTGEAPVQIVYGHANLADIDPTASNPTTVPPVLTLINGRAVESAAMNASDWHLTRRAVFFNNIPETEFLPWLGAGVNGGPGFINPTIVEARKDRADLKSFDYEKWIAGNGLFTTSTTCPSKVFNIWRPILERDFFYNPTVAGQGRTTLDPDPPAGFGGQLAYDLLPGVADFKVEYTYDDPSDATAIEPTRWLDPYIVMAAPPPPFGVRRMEWQSGNPDEIAPPAGAITGSASGDYPWIINPANYGSEPGFPAVPLIKPRTWPRAIRISMRVYDPRAVLGERAEGGRVVDLQEPIGSDRAAQYSPIDFVYVHTF